MTVETEPGLTITVESTEVSSLREGDLLHIAFPAPQNRVLRYNSKTRQARGCFLMRLPRRGRRNVDPARPEGERGSLALVPLTAINHGADSPFGLDSADVVVGVVPDGGVVVLFNPMAPDTPAFEIQPPPPAGRGFPSGHLGYCVA